VSPSPSDAREHALIAADLIAEADLDGARGAIAGIARRTPVLACEELTELAGTTVLLKAECLQRTGSFKLRGALAKVAALGEHAAAGLVTASAGNHARAVAQAARIKGLSCKVFMPRDAAVSKVAAVERLGAIVHLEGASVDESLMLAAGSIAESGAALIHPFDDLDVIAGQGTLGLELIEDVPDLARVVVPLGGGGLASGIAIALRRGGLDVELVGVQAQLCSPYVDTLRAGDGPPAEGASVATIADGIAVKRPGVLATVLLRELLDSVHTVSEDEIADAMVFLADRAKLVAEGAGAVAAALLLAARLPPVAGATVAIVSGGNVDSGLLAGLLRRRETEEGRRVRLFTRVPDRPGGLAELLGVVADARANLVSLEHVREAIPLHVRETGVELTLETRGPGHTDELMALLERAGYAVSPA
jgi:threonine dehydratase